MIRLGAIAAWVSLGLVAACGGTEEGSSDQPKLTTPAQTDAGKSSPAPSLGWPAVDRILLYRESYIRDLRLDRLPGGEKFTVEYFYALKQRKDKAIAWASSAKPEIVFLGQKHDSLTRDDSPEKLEVIDLAQEWCFEELKKQASSTDAILIEQFGDDEPVTSESFVRLAVEQFRSTGELALAPGQPGFTAAEIQQDFDARTDAPFRAIREPGFPPVYYGEEWPLQLEGYLTMAKQALPPRLDPAVQHFNASFNRLRSEIILIRALETLQRISGDKAVLIQGTAHARDIATFADEYRVQLLILLPP